MDKIEILKKISFGARVAEEETTELSKYFVETDQWNRMINGEIDIVRGDKGAGKSAIYSLLVTKTDDLFDRSILLITAEKPRGTTVFKDLEDSRVPDRYRYSFANAERFGACRPSRARVRFDNYLARSAELCSSIVST